MFLDAYRRHCELATVCDGVKYCAWRNCRGVMGKVKIYTEQH